MAISLSCRDSPAGVIGQGVKTVRKPDNALADHHGRVELHPLRGAVSQRQHRVHGERIGVLRQVVPAQQQITTGRDDLRLCRCATAVAAVHRVTGHGSTSVPST